MTTATATVPVEVSRGRFGWAVADALSITWRNLLTLARTPQLLVFATIQPILFVGGAECPAAGVLEVSLSGGESAHVIYTPAGGVQLDVGGDGTIEASFISCDDDDLKDCES